MTHLRLADLRLDVADLATVTKQIVPFKDKAGFKKYVLLTLNVVTDCTFLNIFAAKISKLPYI